jgi:hypothetical protein
MNSCIRIGFERKLDTPKEFGTKGIRIPQVGNVSVPLILTVLGFFSCSETIEPTDSFENFKFRLTYGGSKAAGTVSLLSKFLK